LSAARLKADPKKIWDELQRLNRPAGFGTRMALRRELTRMQKDPRMPMSKWITSVRDVARQIKDLKGDVPDEEVIVVLTNPLPESYAPLVVQLDAMVETDRTISHVITRLIGEERRQAGRDQENDPEEVLLGLLAAKRKRRDRSGITCFTCGKKGHFRSNCPEEQEQEVGNLRHTLLKGMTDYIDPSLSVVPEWPCYGHADYGGEVAQPPCRDISVLVIISTVSVLLWSLNIGHIQGCRPASAFLILVSFVARLFVLHKPIV